jgi:large subunit ribosomal protein L22
MANGHRSQIKRERNGQKDGRPFAKLVYARIPVQKACFVMDAIRGKDIEAAEALLEYSPRYASDVIYKLLKSAVANAENNNGMNAANLFVAECYADNGPIMKRIQPRAQGRAYRILKRECHLTIILDEKGAAGKTNAAGDDTEKKTEETVTAKAKTGKKTAAKKAAPAKKAAAPKKATAAKTKTAKPAAKKAAKYAETADNK